MKAKRFQLKSAMIEVIQYNREENINDVRYFFGKDYGSILKYHAAIDEYILFERPTLEMRKLEKGDYILRNIKGQYRVIDEAELTKYYYEVE